MKSIIFITAATALVSSALANPVNSRSKSTRSTAGHQSVEALLESNNAFSDEAAVIGDVKLLIDSSESILNAMDTRMKRMGVKKHAIRHRSLDQSRPRSSGDNTGKLVPIAQIVERIQKGINELSDIVLKIECPRSLPMADYTHCVAAQEEPLGRLREYYPESMDLDGYAEHCTSSGPIHDSPDGSFNGSLHGPQPEPPHSTPSYGGPPIWGTFCSEGCAYATNAIAKAPKSTHSRTTRTSTVTIITSTTAGIASVSQSPTSALSYYPTFAGKSSCSSSAANVEYATSTRTYASTMPKASVTVSRSTATISVDKTSSYTSLAIVTVNPSYTVTFTMTKEILMPTTSTAEFDVTKTIDVTSTNCVASDMYPDTVTFYAASSSPSPSSDADSFSPDTSYRTVWMPTTNSPYLYGTRTSPVPAAPMPPSSSSFASSSSLSSSQSTPAVPWTVYRSSYADGRVAYPTSYRIHVGP